MKTVLVTGGCGFIGSHFIETLFVKEPETQILNLDVLTYAGKSTNVPEAIQLDSRYHFLYGNICDGSDHFWEALPAIDTIYHFAAETHVDRSIQESKTFLQTNVLGTHALLEAARRKKIRKFMYISTDEVYGPQKVTFWAGEYSPLIPKNPYAASKAAADMLVQSYANTYGMKTLCIRPCNNFGPRQNAEKFIPTVIRCLLRGVPVPLYGDGMQERCWLPVEDCCNKIWKFSQFREGVSNLGSEACLTNLDVVQRIHEVMKLSTPLNVEFIADRPGHDRRYALTGTQPISESRLTQALQETIAWYKENP